MASILDSKPEISDVVLYESEKARGHCRIQATVNVTSAFQIGTVVDNDGDGTYTGILNAGVGTITADVAVVIDDAVYDGVTGDRTITLLQMPALGIAGVKKGGLAYLDAVSDSNKLIVEAALALKGMKTFITV